MALAMIMMASLGGFTNAAAQPTSIDIDIEDCYTYIIQPVVVDDSFDVIEYKIFTNTAFLVFLEIQVWDDAKEGVLTGFSCDRLEDLLCEVGNMTVRMKCIESDDVDVDIDPLTRHVRVDIVRFY